MRCTLVLVAPTLLFASLAPCPPTRWSVPNTLAALASSREFERVTPFLVPIERPEVADELAWLRENQDTLMQQLDDAGALHFRGFSSPSSKDGLRKFCDSLPLVPCEDPLSSIGVRKLLSSQDGVYEAVNSEALSRTFIGLHNDATFKLTAPFAAFACLQPASSGGEFLLADGRAVLAELTSGPIDESALSPLFERNISVRVAALDMDPLFAFIPEALYLPVQDILRTLVGFVLGLAVPLDLQLAWGSPDVVPDASARRLSVLQILEQAKAPVNRHPRSGVPSFFSSLHSQARHLQERRAAIFSQTSVSAIATTDVYFGDTLQPIPPSLLEEVDAVVTRLTKRIAMQPGDLILLDTYQVLHGRDVFEGEREHAVIWLADS